MNTECTVAICVTSFVNKGHVLRVRMIGGTFPSLSPHDKSQKKNARLALWKRPYYTFEFDLVAPTRGD